MAGILSLKPDDEMSLHPEALKWFSLLRKQIEFEVPLEELTDDDFNMFLTDDEKRDFNSLTGEIGMKLSTCINKDGAPPNTNIWDEIASDLKATQAGINLLVPMNSLKFLLEKVYERKVAKAREEERKRMEEEKLKAAKAEEEQRERDEEDKRSREQAEAECRRKEEAAEAERREKEAEERWWAAYRELNIPVDDTFRYLRSEEHQEFVDSIPGAVDAYLAEGKSYVLDRRANNYLAWISVINSRRKKEQEKITANLAAQEYNERFNKEIARLKSVLCPSKKDLNAWFEKKIGDKRYTGHNFDYVLSAEEKDSFDGTLVIVANKKLEQLIPNNSRQFIDIPSQYYRIYFPLPSISYSFEGIPCLDFCFDIFAAAYAEIWLKPREKTFGGYIFNLPWREGKGYSVILQEPELLGYYYTVLAPEDLGGYVFWESIPLVLLRGLLNGETKPAGTTISAVSDGMITYKIPRFKEEVTIPDSFAGYLKNIGNIDQMVSMGIITEKIASVAKNELGEPKAEERALSQEGDSVRKDTKKAKAFELFSQGKRPNDPEVKALGMRKSTRFKYYNLWQNHRV